jgi:hypothetical protein
MSIREENDQKRAQASGTDPMLDFLVLDETTRGALTGDTVAIPATAPRVARTGFAQVVTASTNTPVFEEFPKIPRLNRECVITEKLDGINAVLFIGKRSEFEATISPAIAMTDDLFIYVGTRNQWITPYNDMCGLAKWVAENAADLFTLGPGRHHGEWWGSGVRRDYGLNRGEKRFSLFNTSRWVDPYDYVTKPEDPKVRWAPKCCRVVPVIYRGLFKSEMVGTCIERLRTLGSVASPGFRRPEGVVIFHTAANQMFKATLEKDDEPKGKV